MRPILFLFYLVESMLHLAQIYKHVAGFLSQSLDLLPLVVQINHYFYTLCFYIFTVHTFFSSINICTGQKFFVCEEIIRTAIGFILFISISLMTLHNAERDLHIMYLLDLKHSKPDDPMDPIFYFMSDQSSIALTLGIVYLLNCILVVDVFLTCDNTENIDSVMNSTVDLDQGSGNYAPIHLYILGETIHAHLLKYEWFDKFSRGDTHNI